MPRLSILIFYLSVLTLAGCNLAQPTTPPATLNSEVATAPYIRLAQAATDTPAPTNTRALSALPTQTTLPPTETPEPTQSVFNCEANPVGEPIQHRVQATVDYAGQALQVSQNLYYRNESQFALPELVIANEVNTWQDAFTLGDVTLQGISLPTTLNLNRMTVTLPEALQPTCSVELMLTFTINVPRFAIGINAFRGYFGYGDRQMNLAMWLPTVAPIRGDRWVLYEPNIVGEHWAFEQADWDVRLTVTNSPTGEMVVAAPGTMERLDDMTWHFTLQSARDFTMSLSPFFEITRQMTNTGVQVEVYHFLDAVRTTGEGVQVDGAARTLELAVQSMEQYTSLFGSYPYDRVLVIQGDFKDGMEFTGIVFVSTDWFYLYAGGVQNFLSIITVHEIAHQWWYARVGNDGATAPWMDEALATYSEYIYYEEFYPEFRDWWWGFRVAGYNPQGQVDSTIYEYDNLRTYINAIYLRGVQMLHNLREDIGTEAFFDLLAEYAQTADGDLVTANTFWSLFTPEQIGATVDTRREFLRNPAPIPNMAAPEQSE